ncbi:MAG: GAF domain-containing protein [Candidatus Pacebacteria bacterium]|nr:GAF domain-containing protein [Candidatus Paceibacterota bacterium]
MENTLIGIIGIIVLIAGCVLCWRERSFRIRAHACEIEVRRKVYELAVLEKLGEGMGYSLDVEKVVEMITGSLRQFIEYTTVSYMLVDQKENNPVSFKIDLKESVCRKFVDGVKKKMEDSLTALLEKEVRTKDIKESLSGALVLDGSPEKIESFFNIPLVIGGRVVGLLTVAHTRKEQYKEQDVMILYKIVAQASQAVTKLEQVVKTEQAKLSAVVESLTDGVVMTDREYKVMAVNPAAKRYLGLKDNSSIDIFDLINGLGDSFDIRETLKESITLNKIIITPEVKVEDNFFQLSVSPVKGFADIVKDQILGGVVVLHDVTKEKEAEKLKEEFTSLMIHELRGPLDGIKKVSEVMHDDTVRTDKKTYDEYIKMIFKGSSQMLELVNDLLDVSNIENEKLILSTRVTKLKQVIQGRFHFFDIAAKDRNITMEMNYSENVPVELEMDSIRIEQVLNNLLSNAIKYTELGGTISVDIFRHKKEEILSREAKTAGVEWFVEEKEDVTFRERQDCVIIGITDSGVGIPRSKIGALFTKFDKDNIVTRKGESRTSLGLGLVVVKGVIEAHGGFVGVASQEGKGSTFYFTINI